ncbi:MAG: hypothetical protein R2861_01705 [Desulfobacterales bacterium]
MSVKILINSVDTEECLSPKYKTTAKNFTSKPAAREITQGNIYKGVVSWVEPSLQAVFVDYGLKKTVFFRNMKFIRIIL